MLNVIIGINALLFFCLCGILVLLNISWNGKNYDLKDYIFRGGPTSGELSSRVFWSFWLMINSLLPLEIECAVQINKLIYSFYVVADGWMAEPDYVLREVKQCKVRNMNMIEELGGIKYLFCDKTGTLTQNHLEFKAFSVADT